MRVLILGGTGAMGRELVPILLSRGLEVTVTSRKENASIENLTFRQGNAHDPAFLDELLREPWDAIVDFMNYRAEEFSVKMKQLLSGTGQYVFLSSSRVYADARGLIQEDSPRLPDEPPDKAYLALEDYALEKARSEDLLFDSGRRNWTIIRPYITYNSNRLQLGEMEKEFWLQRALEGRSIVFSKAISEKLTTMTYGGDVAAVIAELVGNPAALGEYVHIAAPKPVRWSEVLDIYCDVLESRMGKRPKILLTEGLNVSAKKPYRKARIYYDRLYDRVFSGAKADRLVGHKLQYTAPQDGLKRCLEEFLDSNRQFLYRSWRFEGCTDRLTCEPWDLQRISGVKQKFKYAVSRLLLPPA